MTGLLFFWYIRHEPPLPIKLLIVIMWYLLLVNIATVVLGALGVSLVTVLFLIAGLGLLLKWKKKVKRPTKRHGRRKSVFVDAYNMIQESIAHRIQRDSFDFCEKEEEPLTSPVLVTVLSDDDDDDDKDDGRELNRKSTVRFKSQSFDSSDSLPGEDKGGPSQEKSSSFDTWSDPPFDDSGVIEQIPEGQIKGTNASNGIFLILITLCTLFIILRYPWLLLLMTPLGVVWCVKKLVQLTSIEYWCQVGSKYWTNLKNWCYTHQAKLFPEPVPTLLQLCKDIDGLALLFLKKTAGSFVSALIIIGLLLGSVALSAFLIFQIQLEITHSVGLATQVLNTSIEQSPFIRRYVI